MVAGLVVAFVSGFVSSSIAQSKGHNGVPYFVLGFFLPLIGILAAGFMAPVEAPERPKFEYKPRLSDHSLAVLRPDGDAMTRTFLEDYRESVSLILRSCAAGELVLAYGRGFAGVQPVVFVVTDQQLVILEEGGSRAKSTYPISEVSLSDDEAGVALPGGVMYPHSSSPFAIGEIAVLLQGGGQAPDSVEVIAPGRLARPGPAEPAEPPEPDESLAMPVQANTDTVGELERLDALHRSGAIDDDEFAELKRKLVWGDGGPTESSG